MNADQKEFVWRSLLDADQNARYWRAMTLRYVRRERAAKIFLAVVASSNCSRMGILERGKLALAGSFDYGRPSLRGATYL